MNQKEKYIVEFITYTDSEITNQIVEKNEEIKKPIDPVKEGYTLEGWYVGQDKWNFDFDVVTTNIKLEAKWKKLTKPIEETDYDIMLQLKLNFGTLLVGLLNLKNFIFNGLLKTFKIYIQISR